MIDFREEATQTWADITARRDHDPVDLLVKFALEVTKDLVQQRNELLSACTLLLQATRISLPGDGPPVHQREQELSREDILCLREIVILTEKLTGQYSSK